MGGLPRGEGCLPRDGVSAWGGCLPRGVSDPPLSGQKDRNLKKHYLAATTLRTVMTR